MAAPKGNKFAVGNSGKPKLWDREKVFSDLIEWAKQPDSINLNKFCATYDPPFSPTKLHDWLKESDEYREAYSIAKSFLGFRREEKLTQGLLHQKAFDLNATVYDLFLKEELRDQANEDAARKKDINSTTPSQVVVKVSNDGLGSGLNVSTTALPNPNNKGS